MQTDYAILFRIFCKEQTTIIMNKNTVYFKRLLDAKAGDSLNLVAVIVILKWVAIVK